MYTTCSWGNVDFLAPIKGELYTIQLQIRPLEDLEGRSSVPKLNQDREQSVWILGNR